MRHKRFAFIRKNAKVVIPILILIIFLFSFINTHQEQSSEGLANNYSIEDLKKNTHLNRAIDLGEN